MTGCRQKGNTPGACHKGISDTGELTAGYPCPSMVFNPVLERAVSAARFSTYRKAANDDNHAWALYRWNIDLVAALAPLTCDLEVTLRNTMHDRLTDYFGREDWWASTRLLLDDLTAETLAEAVKRHQKKITKGTVGAGKVVADLMLGTWVMLLSRGGTSSLGKAIDYESNLWRPALRFGFTTGSTTRTGRERRPTRDAVHSRAANFQRLRNRAAHHEPITDGIVAPGANTRIPLLDVWQQAVELLGWMSPDLASHHLAAAVLPTTLAARP